MPGFHAIGPDFHDGARSVVEHLLTIHEARTVALVIGYLDFVEVNSRERGWHEALARHGLPEGPILEGPFTRDGGYAMGQQLLSSDLPDAVFAISDLQAVGILRAFHEAGLRVPQDIAVVSFDGTKESEDRTDPLSPSGVLGHLPHPRRFSKPSPWSPSPALGSLLRFKLIDGRNFATRGTSSLCPANWNPTPRI